MERDVVYYFSKSDFSKHELGEIQKGFNLSFVIDGTKDSGKMEVINFEETEVEPYTIIYHNATQTWWVITNDKVEKYINDNGFLYKHNLKLLGANELLNARDLTDCGFNANRYTIGDFLERLAELSSFDFRNNTEIDYGSLNSNLSPTKLVDYKKTFENYSLLSALREFLDGYNCAMKLSFETTTENNVEYINKAIFTVVSKTGNTDYQIRNIDYFNTVKETKTMDKNSFGTSVVSNAENVSSTKTKTFPSIGYTRLSAEALEITNTSAVFRLPTPIFKLNYLQLLLPYVKIKVSPEDSSKAVEIVVDTTKTTTKVDLLNQLNVALNNMTSVVPVAEKWWADVQAQIDNIISILENCQRVTFYTGWNLNPVTQGISFNSNSENKYIVSATKYRTAQSAVYQGPWVVGTKEDRNSMQYTPCCIYYERGSNLIRGFDLLAEDNTWHTVLGNYTHTDARTLYDNATIFESYYAGTEYEEDDTLSITVLPANAIELNVRNTQWKVNYVPMSDIKLKYDNNSESNDMQLYNQNGKITDGVALSKLIVSYSKEIESDTITKYRVDYSFSDCPKVGTIVNDSLGNKYVINNVSLDFYQNENGSYYIEGEYTMSKNVATKSLLTNPNSNIRDYGIPQDLNVKRKQVYRDFFEFGATTDTNADTNYYQPLSKVLNLTNFYSEYKDHIGIIKVDYYNGQEWYYQLESTVYPLKKAIYEVIDFNDNNIIGYGSQNAYSGFDISRVFSGMIDTICTPISYVDDNGEIKGINVAFCSIDQVQEIYTNYVNEQNAILGTTYNGVLYNYSVFIPEQIYNGSEEHYVSKEYNYLLTIIGVSQGGLKQINLNSYMAQNNLSGNANRYVATVSLGVGSNMNRQVYESGGSYYIDVPTPISQITIINLNKITEYGYNGAEVVNDFLISEEEYKKDALEVPVFEYACQIDDSDDVDVGENILDNSSGDFLYIYTMYIKPKNYVNVNNSSYFESVADFRINPNTDSGKLDFENLSMNSFNYLSWAVKFEYIDNETLEVSMYESISIDNNKNVTYGTQVRLDNLASEDYSFVFGRYTLNPNTQTQMRVVVDTTKYPTLASFLATNGISGNIYYYTSDGGTSYGVYSWNDVSGWEYQTTVTSVTGSITITSTKSDVLFSLKNPTDYTFTSDGKMRVKINHYKI